MRKLIQIEKFGIINKQSLSKIKGGNGLTRESFEFPGIPLDKISISGNTHYLNEVDQDFIHG